MDDFYSIKMDAFIKQQRTHAVEGIREEIRRKI